MKNTLAKIVIMGMVLVPSFGSLVANAAEIKEPDFGKQLDSKACGEKLGKPLIDVEEKVLNDADSGQGGNYWAMDNYTRHIKAWQISAGNGWDVNGHYVARFVFGDNYDHDMDLIEDSAGNITGTGGGYPAGNPHTYAWTIDSGSIVGNTISFTAHYTASSDAVTPLTVMHVNGTIANDGTMSGTWDDNYQAGNRTGTWSTISGNATYTDSTYCATLTYEGKANAVTGQTGPGGSGTIGADVKADMKGGYRATFSGTLKYPTLWPTKGKVGPVDYACDLLGNCPGVVSWTDQYFDGVDNFDQPWWGWIYKAGKHGSWLNSVDGNLGNIL